MPAMTRKDDPLDGHGCFGGHNIAGSASTVFADGILVSRQGDVSTKHCCVVCHSGNMDGVNDVFVEGMSAQKVGDPVSCGSTQAGGSPTVSIN